MVVEKKPGNPAEGAGRAFFDWKVQNSLNIKYGGKSAVKLEEIVYMERIRDSVYISTSVWSVQHPNTGKCLYQLSQ